MAPLFAEPILAFLLYYVILGAMHLWDTRDKRRVDLLSKKLRKMVAELKVSCALARRHRLSAQGHDRIDLWQLLVQEAKVDAKRTCRTQRGTRRRQSCWRGLTPTMCRPHRGSSSSSTPCGQRSYPQRPERQAYQLRCTLCWTHQPLATRKLSMVPVQRLIVSLTARHQIRSPALT